MRAASAETSRLFSGASIPPSHHIDVITRGRPRRCPGKAGSALAIVEQAGLDLAGPALGGVICAMSTALPFGLNSLGLIIGATLIVRIPAARRPAGARSSARAFLSEVPAGPRWLWCADFVCSIILTGAGLTFST